MRKAINIADLREMSRRRLPKLIFDFVDGGADDEVTLRAIRQQFDRWGLVPRAAVDVATRSTATKFFGKRVAAPFVISPMGLASVVRPKAELALARSGNRFGIPFTLSTAGSVSIEDIRRGTDGPLWFQLYIMKDRQLTAELLERARDAGYEAVVISLDAAVAGQRERDIRNGLGASFRPGPRSILDLATHLGWLFDLARYGMPQPVNLELGFKARPGGCGSLFEYFIDQLDPTVTWKDIEWVRSLWNGPLILKGLISPNDARSGADRGADGVVVSNQGGRQLDSAVSSLEALPRVVEAVGDNCTVFCDSGFRRGNDVVKSLALGAKGVFLGRAALFGAASGGETGVGRALEILHGELDRTMALIGRLSPDAIERDDIWDLRNGASDQLRVRN